MDLRVSEAMRNGVMPGAVGNASSPGRPSDIATPLAETKQWAKGRPDIYGWPTEALEATRAGGQSRPKMVVHRY